MLSIYNTQSNIALEMVIFNTVFNLCNLQMLFKCSLNIEFHKIKSTFLLLQFSEGKRDLFRV